MRQRSHLLEPERGVAHVRREGGRCAPERKRSHLVHVDGRHHPSAAARDNGTRESEQLEQRDLRLCR